MISRPWQPVNVRRSLHEVVPITMLVYSDIEAVIVDAKRSQRNTIEARIRPTGLSTRHRVLGGGQKVDALAAELVGRDARVIALPPVLWNSPEAKEGGPQLRDVASLGAGAVTAAAVLTFLPALGILLGLVAGGGVGALVRGLWPGGRRRKALEFLGERDVREHNVLEYALALETGVEWSQGTSPGVAPADRVASVRQDYGRLRSDLVYRIEHPALFDPKVPTTAAFEEALAVFAAADGSPARLAELAVRVEVTFAVARQHAERTGLRHIGDDDRPAVRRAAKAARLAAGATTDGERAASLAQVQRLLDSVALYYLPASTDDVQAIEPPPGR